MHESFSPPSAASHAASPHPEPPVAEWSATFAELGYAGPVRVLSTEECRNFLKAASRERCRAEWSKGLGAVSPAFYELAAHPVLARKLEQLLGEHFLLWGASLLVRRPGEVHPWHTDIETASAGDGTVTVWIGL